jgi:hypothetical protein
MEESEFASLDHGTFIPDRVGNESWGLLLTRGQCTLFALLMFTSLELKVNYEATIRLVGSASPIGVFFPTPPLFKRFNAVLVFTPLCSRAGLCAGDHNGTRNSTNSMPQFKLTGIPQVDGVLVGSRSRVLFFPPAENDAALPVVRSEGSSRTLEYGGSDPYSSLRGTSLTAPTEDESIVSEPDARD